MLTQEVSEASFTPKKIAAGDSGFRPHHEWRKRFEMSALAAADVEII